MEKQLGVDEENVRKKWGIKWKNKEVEELKGRI